MAPVLQLAKLNWSVGSAACCRMALVFGVMHLHFFYFFFFYCFSPFFLIFFFFFPFVMNLVLINRGNGYALGRLESGKL